MELTGGAQRVRTYDLGAFGVVSPRQRLQSISIVTIVVECVIDEYQWINID
jgi:hypothetical protein